MFDNGPEMTGKAMFFWSQETRVKLHFIQPGKPTQNAFVDSFNGRFRDGCLNQQWFHDLADARRIIDEWREHYSMTRPHSSLGYVPRLYWNRKWLDIMKALSLRPVTLWGKGHHHATGTYENAQCRV